MPLVFWRLPQSSDWISQPQPHRVHSLSVQLNDVQFSCDAHQVGIAHSPVRVFTRLRCCETYRLDAPGSTVGARQTPKDTGPCGFLRKAQSLSFLEFQSFDHQVRLLTFRHSVVNHSPLRFSDHSTCHNVFSLLFACSHSSPCWWACSRPSVRPRPATVSHVLLCVF